MAPPLVGIHSNPADLWSPGQPANEIVRSRRDGPRRHDADAAVRYGVLVSIRLTARRARRHVAGSRAA